MLIYEQIGKKYFVTQVIFGFKKNKTKTHKVKVTKLIIPSHAAGCRKLTQGRVFVTGDTSILGGGNQPRQVYQHLLDGTSEKYQSMKNETKC